MATTVWGDVFLLQNLDAVSMTWSFSSSGGLHRFSYPSYIYSKTIYLDGGEQ